MMKEIKEGDKMTINDIKTGMLILDGEDNLRLVIGNTAIGYTGGGIALSEMEFKQGNSMYSIKKVFAEPKPYYGFNTSIKFWLDEKAFLDPNFSSTKVLWEYTKPEPKKMTVAEICKVLGEDIEIVKER